MTVRIYASSGPIAFVLNDLKENTSASRVYREAMVPFRWNLEREKPAFSGLYSQLSIVDLLYQISGPHVKSSRSIYRCNMIIMNEIRWLKFRKK